ncbi:glycosyltransferase family protein [Fodinibius saliphilus]|uniref:glycosyltransferase family protein n=1 Tax=Fodinibius saliphilus TaxID=1920650 RepID=UPI0011096D5B|nr:glycosyltransferase family protein [Fodinibius saliphilus]
MNILYGIQGTGHGHISRAREVLPELQKHAVVDVMVSGHNNQLSIKEDIKYQKYGISLSYDNNGGIAVLDTLRDFRPIRFLSDVQSVFVTDYDLVISDYEPVSAWAAKLEDVPSIGLSHQASFLSALTPRPPQKSLVAEVLFKHFSPVDYPIGFHFLQYDHFIEPPIIRSAIREVEQCAGNHVTVYLPAYHHKVLQEIFAPFTMVDWHIFSPYCEQYHRKGSTEVHPISHQQFLDSFASCRGVICNAGFETCSEAMYLGKKLLAVPIRNQYEQECNVAALKSIGVETVETLNNCEKELKQWLDQKKLLRLDAIADPKMIVEEIIKQADALTTKQSQNRSRSGLRLF